MRRPVSGVWGMPKEMVDTLLGYGDVEKNREEAREIMRSKGFGPDNRMKLKVITRNIPSFRNPTVIFLDQLSHIYISAELDPIETTNGRATCRATEDQYVQTTVGTHPLKKNK